MSFSRKLKPLDRPVFHLILIAFLGLIAYSNTFDVPFQWDEEYFIGDNAIIKDLNYFLEPSKAKGLEYYDAFKSRYVGYLTFALNYKLHGLDVRGYHVVNIAIHIMNAFLVYFLVVFTFRTPFLKREIAAPSARNNGQIEKSLRGTASRSNLIALFSALLFVSHPIQTEAVTYIFQRLASLAAFFYMLSIVLYIKWRIYEPLRHGDTEKEGKSLLSSLCLRASVVKFSFYMLSLVSAVLAMKTKENAFTLPIMIALYEFFFFEGKIKKRLLWLTPFLLTMLIIPLSMIGVDKSAGEIIGGIGSASRGYEGIPRMDYLFTQFRVIVTYIRLLFLPVNQNFGYDYPIYDSFGGGVALSVMFLASVLSCSLYLFYISKKRIPEFRLMSFGILWFFLALSVESSVIPLPMVINEYRLYLPSVGWFLIAVGGIFICLKKLKETRTHAITIALFAMITLVLLYGTHSRNSIWRNEISLWEDVTIKSPRFAMGHFNLANKYQSHGLLDAAIREYQIAIQLKPDFAEAHNNLGNEYHIKGLPDKAIEHYERALFLNSSNVAAHNNLGLIYQSKGHVDYAIEHFRKALSLDPYNAAIHYNIGIAYSAKGAPVEAKKHLDAAQKLGATMGITKSPSPTD